MYGREGSKCPTKVFYSSCNFSFFFAKIFIGRHFQLGRLWTEWSGDCIHSVRHNWADQWIDLENWGENILPIIFVLLLFKTTLLGFFEEEKSWRHGTRRLPIASSPALSTGWAQRPFQGFAHWKYTFIIVIIVKLSSREFSRGDETETTARKELGFFYGSSYIAAPDGSRTPVSVGLFSWTCHQGPPSSPPQQSFVNFKTLKQIKPKESRFPLPLW